MKSKRIRLGAIGIIVSALVAGAALWTSSIPFAREIFAQAAQQTDDHGGQDHRDHTKVPTGTDAGHDDKEVSGHKGHDDHRDGQHADADDKADHKGCGDGCESCGKTHPFGYNRL